MKKCLAPLEDRVRNRSVFVFEEAAFRPDSHTLDPELAFAEEESAQAEHGGKGKGKKSRHQHRVQVHFWIRYSCIKRVGLNRIALYFIKVATLIES